MVRRHDHLFAQVANFAALHSAAQRAVAGKRKKPGAAAFFANLEGELLRLERELQDQSYRTGRYLEIMVRDPKRRLVSAAPFRDRVVHHALFATIGPIFECGFIDDSYANRTDKGTHRALARYEHYRDRYRHVLRADIYRYFPSIDHAVLKTDLRRRIACKRTLALCDTIIDGSNPQEVVLLHFAGDDLLTPLERRRGLPLGGPTFAPTQVVCMRLHPCRKPLTRHPYWQKSRRGGWWTAMAWCSSALPPRLVSSKGWSGLNSTEAVRVAADLLVEYGHLRPDLVRPGQAGGRPSEQYLVNPRCFLGG